MTQENHQGMSFMLTMYQASFSTTNKNHKINCWLPKIVDFWELWTDPTTISRLLRKTNVAHQARKIGVWTQLYNQNTGTCNTITAVDGDTADCVDGDMTNGAVNGDTTDGTVEGMCGDMLEDVVNIMDGGVDTTYYSK